MTSSAEGRPPYPNPTPPLPFLFLFALIPFLRTINFSFFCYIFFLRLFLSSCPFRSVWVTVAFGLIFGYWKAIAVPKTKLAVTT